MSDTPYRTFPYRFVNGGIVARDVYDKMRPASYQSLSNLESREENSLSTRYGLAALTTNGTSNFPLAAPAQSLGRMKGLTSPYDYAVGGTVLYRKATDGIGAYSSIATGLSGSRVSMFPYRPNNTSAPYMFIADDTLMLKDSGSGNAFNWGILPPTSPCLIGFGTPSILDIELFDETSPPFGLGAISSPVMLGRTSFQVQQTISVAGPVLITPQIAGESTLTRTSNVSTFTSLLPHNFVSGMRVSIFSAADPTYNVGSVIITVTGASTFTYPNSGSNGSTTGAGASPMPSIQVGMNITTQDATSETVYVTEVFSTGFVANFVNTHTNPFVMSSNYFSGNVAANATGTITKIGAFNITFAASQENPDDNLIQIYVMASNPLAITEVKIMFDVGDGTFTQDYYWKSASMNPAQPAASGTVTTGVVQSGAVAQRAAGVVDVRTLGGNDPSLLPTDYPALQQLQPAVLNPGTNPWTLISVPIGEFVAAGQAGSPTNNWSNVLAWRIQITTAPNLTTTIGLDDLIFIGGSDLNSFAGQQYDYRSTYYNINTGDESSPSVIMIATTFGTALGQFPPAVVAPIPLSVQNQPILVQPVQPTDPQVTHIRIYRRGGSLTQAWYMVTQIAVGTLTFLDTIADSVILNNNILNVDADAPVTTLLPTPVNSTFSTFLPSNLILGPGLVTAKYVPGQNFYPGQLVTFDTGQNQEQFYITAVFPGSFEIEFYAQLYHGHGFPHSVQVTATTRPATPMNLMAIAFDKAWLAGDPNNPHVLYYSTTYQPETFPVENSLEIGTPDSPIMALIELNGLLYVFTTKRVYQVLGAGSAVPTIIPTGVRHGLAAQFAWCCAENAIYYLSYDGIYVFSGGASGYLSEPVEWVWTGKNFGPVPAINPAQISNVFMAYANHEVFVCYTDSTNQTIRLIFHDVYRRWRNDSMLTGSSLGVTAEYFAEDVGILFVAKSDAMVYQDRVNDFDSGGFVSGIQIQNAIPFYLQTSQMDQSEVQADYAKRYKQYNEVTIDADLKGQTVTVELVFDSGLTTISLGTITGSGAGRQQFQLNINSGDGYQSLNVGLVLSGTVTVAPIFSEIHIRAAVQAEARRSWDTWWLGYGVDEWHLYKQIFAEYQAEDPGGIVVNAFIDGNMTTPAFTFTLPQTPGTHRLSNKVRFPATKCRQFRLIGTSASDFHMYDDTQIEHKKLGGSKGYERGKISP